MSKAAPFDIVLPLDAIGTVTNTPTQGMDDPTNVAVANVGTVGVTTYTYAIVAVNADGNSASSPVTGTTATGNATLTNAHYNTITWDAVPGAATYWVFRTVGGSTQGYLSEVAALTYSDKFQDTPDVSTLPQDDTTYGYKVVARGPTGSGVASSEATGANEGYFLTAVNYNTLTWDAVDGATSYDVYRTSGSTVGNSSHLGKIGNTSDVTFTDDGSVQGDASTAPSTDTTGTSAPVDVLHLSDLTWQVGGSFVGTVKLQGSINGTDWVVEDTETTPSVKAIAKTYALLRVWVSAYTSGTPTAWVSGHRKNV